ncbi:MAG: LTA synthase family protein, partial [Dysgonamonadaceae bacterium]|nr:LTA synthase family protein [Dysgonamonadaceae bacterium]
TADHVNAPFREIYYNDLGLYSIPIFFYHPGSHLKGVVDSIPTQQIDIMPTVLAYLNYDKPYFAYGQDIFTTKASDKFVINYNNGIYQLLQDNLMLQFDGEKTKAVYNYKEDPLLRNNLYGQKPEEQNAMEMLTKSVVQQYLVRMMENRLKIEN